MEIRQIPRLRSVAPDYEHEPPITTVLDRTTKWLAGEQCWTLIGRGDLRVLVNEITRLRALAGEKQ